MTIHEDEVDRDFVNLVDWFQLCAEVVANPQVVGSFQWLVFFCDKLVYLKILLTVSHSSTIHGMSPPTLWAFVESRVTATPALSLTLTPLE